MAGVAPALADQADARDEVSLAELFSRGAAAYEACDSGDSSGAERGAEDLRLAAARVEAAGVFSRNESAEDIATADAKYLLVPFYLAEVLGAVRGDAESRVGRLMESGRRLAGFLARLEDYGLVPREVAEARERAGATGNGRLDPGAAREAKVARFRAERAVKQKLEALDAARKARGGGEAEGGDGEELERGAWLARVELAAIKAQGSLESLEVELQMLRRAGAAMADGRMGERGPGDTGRGPGGPPRPVGPGTQPGGPVHGRHLASGGVVHIPAPGADPVELPGLGAAVRVESQRQRVAREVFRPTHILPTMTVEQFGELEAARMRKEAEAQAEAQAAEEVERLRREADRGLDGAEAGEEEAGVLKARAWDDWKDDNPRGSGNSRSRPLGS